MIYFDNNATTQIAPEVLAAMQPFLTGFYGNPSSAYSFGRETRKIVENSRREIADLLGASDPHEVVFTSGGTESDNWAILGTLEVNSDKKHIVTTQVEHKAVRNPCEKLEKKGYEITWLEVDENGALNLNQLKDSLREDTAIVSVMMANNETGILFPVEEISEIVKENSNAIFHVDGVNAVGKIPINLAGTQIDLFSLSGHKFHAPKGIGALYIRNGVKLSSLFVGGGQEKFRRPGTEDVAAVAGFAKAVELLPSPESAHAHFLALEQAFFKTMEVKGVKATLHLCADGAETDRVGLVCVNKSAVSDDDRRDCVAGTVQLMREALAVHGVTEPKEVQQDLSKSAHVPARVTYTMTGTSTRDGRRWYASGVTCFGRNTYAVQSFASTESAAARLSALAYTLEEPTR